MPGGMGGGMPSSGAYIIWWGSSALTVEEVD